MRQTLLAMLSGAVLLGASPTTTGKPTQPLRPQPATATDASCRDLDKAYRVSFQEKMAQAKQITSAADKNSKAGSKEWHEAYRQSSRTMDEAWNILTTGWREYGRCKAALRERQRQAAKTSPTRPLQGSKTPATTKSAGFEGPDLHAGWEERNQKRKTQEAEIMARWEKILQTVPEGSRREELLRSTEMDLDRIHQSRAADPEPKRVSGDKRPSAPELRQASDASPAPRQETFHDADVGAAKKLLAGGFEEGAKSIERDLDQARKRFSKKDWERFEPEARDTAGAMRGLGKMVKYSDYGKHVAEFVAADTPVKQIDAVRDLTTDVGKDVGAEYLKAAKPEIINTVAKFFGKRSALVFEVLAGMPLAVGVEVLSSENTGRDPQEIVRDNSGRVSLSDKQLALRELWRLYDKHGSTWSLGQKRELLVSTRQVYEQASEESSIDLKRR